MNILEVQNNQLFAREELPSVSRDEFLSNITELLDSGCRMIALTPADLSQGQKITAVFADRDSSTIKLTEGDFTSDPREFESTAQRHPQTNYFECELAENHGYAPRNHPWLRPVRAQKTLYDGTPYEFYRLKGEEVHEVAVGPIHAGIIEPGHFRFQCHGELVYNLEISLGYQHRGVEQLLKDARTADRLPIAESITGDTLIGHTLAHCGAIEALSHRPVPLRAEVIRAIAAEIERIAMHLSGLGGIANDVGFALPASSYGRLRTLAINSLAELCGSRFGRGLLRIGGTRFDFTDAIIEKIRGYMTTIKKDIFQINDYLFSSVGAMARFEECGIVEREHAARIGLVGFIARSCGIEEDIRIHHPYGAYKYNPVSMITIASGDVFARARLRALEIDEALKFIFEQIENLPTGAFISEPGAAGGSLSPDSGVIALTEGWRGEIVHTLFTGPDGNLTNYKIKDPSFNNWYALTLALRTTAISDFPLCNKSFDQSYAGHDL